MAKLDVFVSATAVLQNNADVLVEFVHDLSNVLQQHYSNYEILLIDNGSVDQTSYLVRELLNKVPCVRYLPLTRRVEGEMAVQVGLDAAIGDYVVNLNPDYDPPAELVSMINQSRLGTDVVIGVDQQPDRRGIVYRTLQKIFVILCQRLLNVNFVEGTTGFRVLTRHAVNSLVNVRQRRRFFAILTTDIGLTTSLHIYSRISRSGKWKNRSLPQAILSELSALVHNSITPLRMATGLGLVGSLLSLAYSFDTIGIYLFKSDVMPGWTTLSLLISGLFAMMFLILAFMGEYVGRLLEESTDRPLDHLREEQSSYLMITDPNRRNVLKGSEEVLLGST